MNTVEIIIVMNVMVHMETIIQDAHMKEAVEEQVLAEAI